MEFKVENGDGIDSWKEVTLVYSAALRQMETKMQILNDEFQHVHQYNPIEHIKARIKTPESIVKKLKRYGQESTIDNMVKYINDIAGIRIICSFTSDIYRIADMIRDQRDIKVIAVKDYITYPKASGYKSYHMIVSIPVYLSDRTVDTKVEVQIRTVAMDFWASLEHKIQIRRRCTGEYQKRTGRMCAHGIGSGCKDAVSERRDPGDQQKERRGKTIK